MLFAGHPELGPLMGAEATVLLADGLGEGTAKEGMMESSRQRPLSRTPYNRLDVTCSAGQDHEFR